MVSEIFVEERSQTLLYSCKLQDYALKWTIASNEPNYETQKRTKQIEIHQSQITNHDLLNSFK